MNTNDNLSSETLAGDAQLTASDGGETVANTDALSLADLNKIFGTTFKDSDAALTAIRETKSYVGKKKEDVAAELAQSATVQAPTTDPALKAEVQTLKNDLFFSSNPQFKEHRSLIESMGNPAEVVERVEVKSLLEKAQAADAVSQNRSVVTSSSRIGQEKSVMDTAVQVANGGGNTEAVANVLAKAVLESLES